jgi:hypothetical protein
MAAAAQRTAEKARVRKRPQGEMDTPQLPGQGPARKRRATDLLKLAPWLSEPAREFARGLALPGRFGGPDGVAAEVPGGVHYGGSGSRAGWKFDWDGWVREQLRPELWSGESAWWTRLIPACVESRAYVGIDADTSSTEDVKVYLVRLLMHNIVARAHGFETIHDLPAEQRASIRPTAADHASDRPVKLTLGVIIDLALALYAFDVHQKIHHKQQDLAASTARDAVAEVLGRVAALYNQMTVRNPDSTAALRSLINLIADLNAKNRDFCVSSCCGHQEIYLEAQQPREQRS